MQSSVGQPDFGVDKHRALHNASAGSLRVFGAQHAIIGTPPEIEAGLFKIQAGTRVETTSLGGDITITYPTPFPTGLLSVVVSLGTTAPFYVAVWDTSTISEAYVRTYDNAGNPVAGSLLRFNWIAIGW